MQDLTAKIQITEVREAIAKSLDNLVQTVIGTKAQRVIGTAVPKVIGTEAQKVIGTTVPKAIGTAVPRVIGTVVQGVIGTIVQKVIGTAVPKVIGTKVPKVIGTKVQKVIGTKVQKVQEVIVIPILNLVPKVFDLFHIELKLDIGPDHMNLITMTIIRDLRVRTRLCGKVLDNILEVKPIIEKKVSKVTEPKI